MASWLLFACRQCQKEVHTSRYLRNRALKVLNQMCRDLQYSTATLPEPLAYPSHGPLTYHSTPTLSLLQAFDRYTSLEAPLLNVRHVGRDAVSKSVSCVTWYPIDTGLFASASHDCTVRLWDTNTCGWAWVLCGYIPRCWLHWIFPGGLGCHVASMACPGW